MKRKSGPPKKQSMSGTKRRPQTHKTLSTAAKRHLVISIIRKLTGVINSAEVVSRRFYDFASWAYFCKNFQLRLAVDGGTSAAMVRITPQATKDFYDMTYHQFASYIVAVWNHAENKDAGTKGRKNGTSPGAPKVFAERSSGSAHIEIFFATNREKLEGTSVNKMFGSTPSDTLQYGTVKVSIPHSHVRGKVERPSVFRFEFKENPRKHIVLQSVNELDEDSFFEYLLKQRKSIGKNEPGTAFVFVHGYNVSFAEGARCCAQISYDMFLHARKKNEVQLSCVPIMFSWPSHGKVIPYSYDGTNAEDSASLFQQFMIDVSKKTGATDIVVLAHSMGSRPVIAALQNIGLAKALPQKKRIREVILAAPDYNKSSFVKVFANFTKATGRTTLYASSSDRALTASKKFHGFPRLGDVDGGICGAAGMDSIDATAAGEDLLGHSNFSKSRLLADIYEIVVNRKIAQERTYSLLPVSGPPAHWQVRR